MKKETFSEEDVIISVLRNAKGEDAEIISKILMKHLDAENRNELVDIMEGKRLPSLASDIIAKKIFDTDEHPERLEFLLRNVADDDSIQVDSSFANKGHILSGADQKVIFDILARLMDNRLSVTELQISASDLLLLQYSVEEGQKKGDLQFKNTSGILLVVLMKESPKVFKKFKSERYIHRFKTMTADSGFAYAPMETVIYVQLDKCLQQFLEGKDGEDNNELQLLLSAMADINNPEVIAASKDSPFMKDIYSEVKNMSEKKEVQAMLLTRSVCNTMEPLEEKDISRTVAD